MINKSIFYIFLYLFLFFNQVLFAQVDFDNYKTLTSQGNIPLDFTARTYDKIETEIRNETSEIYYNEEESQVLSVEQELLNQKKIFLKNIHYGIDEILHSGIVVFGDDVSNYTKKIATILLKNDTLLLSKLRFYTLKSNHCNAFSTDQGIIFVTTGLIARLQNESQLAFIIAHEIAHYNEKHVLKTFQYHIENKNNTIKNLSIYSKDKEFEADKLGLRWYFEAGYGKNELSPTFDVMTQTHLPFDNIQIPKEYFYSNQLYIPEYLFPSKKYLIKTNEDYNDEESSHPNIKKRKTEIELESEKYSSWSNKIYQVDEKIFFNIRMICRFETIRTDIIEANYGNALYSIFLLEQHYPQSIFLKKMKAQSWLGLVKYKKQGDISETINNINELEGESALIHFFIHHLNLEALQTIALRNIYDLKKSLSNNKEINEIFNVLVSEIAKNENFNLDNYSKINFEPTTVDFHKEINLSNSINDSITKNKSQNSFFLDSTNFYLFGIYDILSDTIFTKKYNSLRRFELLLKDEPSTFIEESKDEQLYINTKDFIIVDPSVLSYKHGNLDLIKSEKLKQDFSYGIKLAANDLNSKVNILDRDHLSVSSTELFNDRSTLLNFMSQVSQKNYNVFPVDYECLETIKQNYGSSKVLFSWVIHVYDVKPTAGEIFLFFIVAYPSIPIYLSIKLFMGNHTEMNVAVFDLDKGNIDVFTKYLFKDKPNKYQLGAHMYNLLKKMSRSKIN